MQENREQMRHLGFSCQNIEIDIKHNEVYEGHFRIYANNKNAECRIYSSDTRMQLVKLSFNGEVFLVEYRFDSDGIETGSHIKGEFTILSNYGEYTIPYSITVQKPQLHSSLGQIKNLFHFTNLAQANWQEAVELFYSPDFAEIFQKSDKNLYLSYVGFSKNYGNNQNVEEFLIEMNKKSPIIYDFDISGFWLEDIEDSMYKTTNITRNTWGYSELKVCAYGDFLQPCTELITSDDFENNKYEFSVFIDAQKLHNGINTGKIIFSDACNEYTLPIEIVMEDNVDRRDYKRTKRTLLAELVKNYIDFKLKNISWELWIDKADTIVEKLRTLDEDDILIQLYYAELLLAKERYNEAKWYLDNTEERIVKEKADNILKYYCMYVTTLFNQEDIYIQTVCDEIDTAYVNDKENWLLGLMLFNLEKDFDRNLDNKWSFIEDMYDMGCTSPLIYCEAFLMLNNNPKMLLKLDKFEEQVLLFGARRKVLSPEIIDQMQYLTARKKEFSPILFITLCEVYKIHKSAQTIAAICQLLILGDKQGAEYFKWYALGVEYSVRVTKLYEYYMMSLDVEAVDLFGKKKNSNTEFEIPKMVLLYFAYQSTLEYDKNAFLYAYVLMNSDRYPDIEQSYKIAIERFVIEQIKQGRINENLAYIYQKVLVKQMLTSDTAYTFAPLLFMHKISLDNKNIKSVVVMHEKVNGESTYPVVDGVCMAPIYGNEYKLFLQDDDGNRFTQSVGFLDIQLMDTSKMVDYVSDCMQGRLSFDIYLCELDKNYITINSSNLKRYKNLAQSPQVIEGFKKEIRTRLLRYYYDNDMIGELDGFLEEMDADEMERHERAEFIKYLISRGMFEKAYQWIKDYGLANVEPKAVARLISKRIITKDYAPDEFLINVSYYIYKNMKYDEVILTYLMMHYEGKVTDLRHIWKSAIELELDTCDIMYRILKQIHYCHVVIPEKDLLILEYSQYEEYDYELVDELLQEAAYDYFVNDAIIHEGLFDKMYENYAVNGIQDKCSKLALIRYWSENPQSRKNIPKETITELICEFLRLDIYFPFFQKLAQDIPELHYFKDRIFVEYRTVPGTRVKIHYIYEDFNKFDTSTPDAKVLGDFSRENALKDDEKLFDPSDCNVYEHSKSVSVEETDRYNIEDMHEMFEGIYVCVFQLFYGEALQYYITEDYVTDDGYEEESVTQSDTLLGDVHNEKLENEGLMSGRFAQLNDIIASIELQDEMTSEQLSEEYIYQDFCVRELFRVI